MKKKITKLLMTDRLILREFEENDSLRSPQYIFNLLERLGPKKCVFCNCEIPQLIEGAHVWSVADIKRDPNLSRAQKLEKAIAQNVAEGKIRTYDMGGSNSTTEVANDIARIFKGL